MGIDVKNEAVEAAIRRSDPGRSLVVPESVVSSGFSGCVASGEPTRSARYGIASRSAHAVLVV